jgi:hypothetical protein
MSLTRYTIAITLMIACCLSVFAQSEKQRSVENSFRGIRLSFLSQRCLPKDKVPYVGDDFIDFSDMLVRFRLENRGKGDIYYLADNILSSIEPAGFQLSRKSKGAKWEATNTPARGREGIFTGEAYKWLLLPPGTAIEFEFTDLSAESGEHSASVFLNTEPEHKNRIELISNAYIPKKCPKVNK